MDSWFSFGTDEQVMGTNVRRPDSIAPTQYHYDGCSVFDDCSRFAFRSDASGGCTFARRQQHALELAKMAFSANEVEMSLSCTLLELWWSDNNLAYVSSVRRLNNDKRGVALRYFSLGNITFTDEVGTTIRDFQPAELSLDGGFSQKFTDKFSGFSARFIHSNLTGGTAARRGEQPRNFCGRRFEHVLCQRSGRLGKQGWHIQHGIEHEQSRCQMSYTETANRDFIPSNLRIERR